MHAVLNSLFHSHDDLIWVCIFPMFVVAAIVVGSLPLFSLEVLRLQHFYNIFITNHSWLVVIGSNLNLTPSNSLLLKICYKNVVKML